jgi:hypothetical protein
VEPNNSPSQLGLEKERMEVMVWKYLLDVDLQKSSRVKKQIKFR